MKDNKILVTGGAGFIGSCLVKNLLLKRFKVLVYDNFFTGKFENLPKSNESYLTIVEGDIIDQEKLSDSLEKFQPSLVFHLAGLHYIPYCNKHPLETLRVNVEGTQSILEVCKRLEIEKIIFTSSAAIYRAVDYALQEKEYISPIDSYGFSKFFAEKLIELFHTSTATPCIIARLFNVYGPNETNPHVIPHIIDQLKSKHTLELGNLNPKRDYIYVGDVASALITLAQFDTDFDIFNIGNGKEYSVQDIINVCGKILVRNLRVVSKERLCRKIDRLHLLSDISKIKSATGWSPKFDLETGLIRLLKSEGIIK